jgi:DNA-binding transcriptional LysR family regulator
MNIDSLDVRLLRALVMLVEQRSVSSAALRLGVSQPTMSRLLKRWRTLTHDELLVQAGRAMQPTPRALEMARVVSGLIADLDDALRARPSAPGESKRTFRLAAWDYTQVVVLPRLLRELGRVAPGVVLEAQPWIERQIHPALERGDLDLAVGLFRALPAGCYRKALFGDRFVCFARTGHPVVKRRLTLDDFVRMRHLLVAPFGVAKGAVDIALKRRGLERHVTCYVAHFHTAPEILRATDLIATLPERAVTSRAGLRRFAPPIALPEFEVELVWHERTQRSPEHRWLREQLFCLFGTDPRP